MIQKGFQEMKTQETAAKLSAHKCFPTFCCQKGEQE